MKTDREICAAATDGPWEFGFYNVCSKEEAMELAGLNYDATKSRVGVRPHGYGAYIAGSDVMITNSGYSDGKSEDNSLFTAYFNPQKVTQMLDRQEQLESKLKEASEFIQKLGSTIDYNIVAEIEEDAIKDLILLCEAEKVGANENDDRADIAWDDAVTSCMNAIRNMPRKHNVR